MDKVLAYLKKQYSPNERMEEEDMNVQDWAGGNFDDAYNMGQTDGEQFFIGMLIGKIERGEI